MNSRPPTSRAGQRRARRAEEGHNQDARTAGDIPLPRDFSREGSASHDFGHDGISALVTHDRALRAREVSRPRPEDEAAAIRGAEELLRRLSGGTRRR